MDLMLKRWALCAVFSCMNNGIALLWLGALLPCAKKKRSSEFWLCWSIDTLVLFCANGAGMNPFFTGALFVATKLLLTQLFYEGTRIQKWLVPLFLPLAFLAANMASAAILWTTQMLPRIWIQKNPYFIEQSLWIAKCLLLLVGLLLRQLVPLRRSKNIPWWALLTPLILPLASFLILIETERLSRPKYVAHTYELWLMTGLVGVINLTTFFLIRWMGKVAQDYLTRLIHQQTQRVLAVNTHNPIVDAIFNRYYYAAKREAVEIEFSVNDLSGLALPAEDLAVVLSNLLDNAMEACACLRTEKHIQVEMTRDAVQQEVFLSLRNTSLPVNIEGNRILSTKSDPTQHGYGLKNVQSVLEKYGADSVMDYRDGWFQFTAMIPEPQTNPLS